MTGSARGSRSTFTEGRQRSKGIRDVDIRRPRRCWDTPGPSPQPERRNTVDETRILPAGVPFTLGPGFLARLPRPFAWAIIRLRAALWFAPARPLLFPILVAATRHVQHTIGGSTSKV